MDKNLNKLPEAVAKEFTVKNGFPFKFVHRKFGKIDLNKINIDQAQNISQDPNTGLIRTSGSPKSTEVPDKSTNQGSGDKGK